MSRTRNLIACLALLTLPVMADTGVSFAGLKTDPKAPVQVQADTLSVDQKSGTAIFTGNVVVTQSDMELRAPKVTVNYAADSKSIASLHAEDGVTMKAGTNAASADEAVYTVTTSGLVLTGHVLLTEAGATLAGQTLRVDLKSGLGTMEGRVTSTFTPSGK